MNDPIYELGALRQGFIDIGNKIDDGVRDIKRALEKHVDDDEQTFAAHDVRLTKLEHAAVKAAVIGGLVMFALSAISAAAASYFFR